DAVGDIRSAAFCRPLIDVMRLGVRRWPVAARHSAHAITDGERDTLLRREESLFAADVERASRLIQGDRDDSTDAPLAVDEFTGDRLSGFLEVSDSRCRAASVVGRRAPCCG